MTVRFPLGAKAPLTPEGLRSAGGLLGMLASAQRILADEVWRSNTPDMPEPVFRPGILIQHLSSAVMQSANLTDKSIIRRIFRENVPWLFEDDA